MDAPRFDRIALRLAPAASRRRAVRLLALGALGLAAAPRRDDARAKKRRARNKPLPFNAFGCLDVGRACRGNAALCCSGVCQGNKPRKGKPDRSRCAAHDEGTLIGGGGCRGGQGTEFCGGEEIDVFCITATGQEGNCQTTTGGAGYCRAFDNGQPCARDADCRKALGPRAACVVCAGAPEGTLCAGPDAP